MISLRSRALIGFLRNRHHLKFQWNRPVADESFSLEEFRSRIDTASLRIPFPKDTEKRDVDVNGIHGEWILPRAHHSEGVLLYIHGGGFVSGSCLTHRSHVAKFARACGLEALVFDYRLAPEHPFPAALEDCLSVYRWILDQGVPAEKIVLGGESAGGTLVLSTLLAVNNDEGLPLPRGAFSISPLADFRCVADSFVRNAFKDIALLESWNLWGPMYYGDRDPTDPLISPLFGDYRGLPPIHLTIGEHEVHYDDCMAVAQRARDYGVQVTLREWEGMVHAFPLMAPLFPEAMRALEDISGFVSSLLDAT